MSTTDTSAEGPGSGAGPSPLYTSDLSINEFALLHGVGFEPLKLVMGVSVYHVGLQGASLRQSQELTVLTEAMYHARWNAMSRMQAEADAVGADGVVGVRLEWRPVGHSSDNESTGSVEHVEFIAIGTAVRYTPQPGAYRRPNGQAFSSHLSGQDLTTLLRSGHAPLAFVLGNCVYHVAARTLSQVIRQAGTNVEMEQWTQGNYEARELAMSRMQAEAERDGATGVVGVRFAVDNYVWGPRTLEFHAEGTAIRRVGEGQTITPGYTLPMTD